MISQTQAQTQTQTSTPSIVPHEFAMAATRYQLFRGLEAEHLAIMARENLVAEWSAETRATVVAAREYVQGARKARAFFRDKVREYVLAFRPAHEPLSKVLRDTRSVLQALQRSGDIQDDNGWFEAEVLEWAIEEYERIP